MRVLWTIFSALCLLLLAGALFFWVRSQFYYEGVVRFSVGATGKLATASKAGKSVELEVPGRSAGLISFRGQLTYASVANALTADPWEAWSHPLSEPLGAGSMALMFDARAVTGITAGAGTNSHELVDPNQFSWKLPYTYITTPYWFLCVLLALPPYFWITNYRLLARREREGRCLKCGHELNEAPKCPNCGAANVAIDEMKTT